MAKSHERWVSELLGELDVTEIEQLYSCLDHLKNRLSTHS